MKHNYRIAIPFLLIYLLISASCNFSDKNVDNGYYFQDFDNLYYWNHSALLTSEKAHSGDFSTYVDSLHEFSQTFEMDLSHAKYKGYKSVRIKAWCFKNFDDDMAGLVATITSGDQTLVRNSSDISRSIKNSGSWGACTFSMDLPQKFPDNSKIRVYLWTNSRDKVFLDDVAIIFRK